MAADLVEEDLHQRQQLAPRQGRAALARNAQGQARVGHHAAAQHQVLAAAALARQLGVLHRPDLAVGDEGDGHGLAHGGDALPVGRRLVAIGLGAGMHDDLVSAGRVDGTRHVQRAAVIHVAQAHLGRHHHLGRHRAAHGGHDLVDQLRLVQQHRAAAVAVHALGRAAEVEVDPLRLELRQPPGVLGQAVHVGAQQLRMHRHTRRRAAAVPQLRHDAREHALGQQLVGHADELGHAAVDAAHAREHVAQDVVEQALHGRQQDHCGCSMAMR
ncbi:hypothetical protein ASD35_08850 [Pelomonas sp. Root1444]|nr:hypothetical protein ASD35_08850 [Pelomonas sp. Root1444]